MYMVKTTLENSLAVSLTQRNKTTTKLPYDSFTLPGMYPTQEKGDHMPIDLYLNCHSNLTCNREKRTSHMLNKGLGKLVYPYNGKLLSN